MLAFKSPPLLAPLLLAVLLPFQAAEATPLQHTSAATLTLETVMAEAFASSPALAVAQAEVDEARGRLVAARTFPHNPEVEISVAGREGLGGRSTDRGAEISQQLEIGGQRSRRVAAAELELKSLEASLQRVRRVLAASVAMAFTEAVASEDLAELAAAETELARELLSVTRRRFEAGAATQIELNLAQASTARSERRKEIAGAAVREAQSLLADAAGLDPAAPPIPIGALDVPAAETAPLDELVRGAIANRADLDALAQVRQAAEARLRLAKSERTPDLTVGAFYEEEEGTDRILGVGVGISLPIFNRNRGEIAEAQAVIERATAESASQDLAVRREVFSALVRYEAARRSAEQLGEQVVGSLVESLDLLERSFAAGKMGLSDLLVFRSELIEARREHIEALAAAWMGRIALDLAAGRFPVPTLGTSPAHTTTVPQTDLPPEIDR